MDKCLKVYLDYELLFSIQTELSRGTNVRGSPRPAIEWRKLNFVSKNQRMHVIIKSSTRDVCGDGTVLYLDFGGIQKIHICDTIT